MVNVCGTADPLPFEFETMVCAVGDTAISTFGTAFLTFVNETLPNKVLVTPSESATEPVNPSSIVSVAVGIVGYIRLDTLLVIGVNAELLLMVGADINCNVVFTPLYCSLTDNVELASAVICSPVDFASVDWLLLPTINVKTGAAFFTFVNDIVSVNVLLCPSESVTTAVTVILVAFVPSTKVLPAKVITPVELLVTILAKSELVAVKDVNVKFEIELL